MPTLKLNAVARGPGLWETQITAPCNLTLTGVVADEKLGIRVCSIAVEDLNGPIRRLLDNKEGYPLKMLQSPLVKPLLKRIAVKAGQSFCVQGRRAGDSTENFSVEIEYSGG